MSAILYDYEGESWSIRTMSQFLKINKETLRKKIIEVGFENAVYYFKNRHLMKKYCTVCGKESKNKNFCSIKCRKEHFLTLYQQGKLDKKYIKYTDCQCGCGQKIEHITFLKSTRYYSDECRLKSLRDKQKINKEFFNRTKGEQRPEKCQTCQKYEECLNLITKLDPKYKTWPCLVKKSFDDYVEYNRYDDKTKSLHVAINYNNMFVIHKEY